MSDAEDPYLSLPSPKGTSQEEGDRELGSPSDKGETFASRLRRRRLELSHDESEPAPAPSLSSRPAARWQVRAQALVAMVADSPHAAALITRKSGEAAAAVPGVVSVIFAENLPPFFNSLGHEFSGEPVLAADEVSYLGQPVALVVAETEAACLAGIAQLSFAFQSSQASDTLDHAVALEHFIGEARICQRGEVDPALARSERSRTGSFVIGSTASGLPTHYEVRVSPSGRGSGLIVSAPSLVPSAVRSAVARAAEILESEVQVLASSLPGIQAGLELEPIRLAVLATHAVRKCRRPVVLKCPRSSSILTRGPRHAAQATYRVGFNHEGKILGLDLKLYLDGGPFASDSPTILDRALLHADSVYAIPHLRLSGQLCRTHQLVSSSHIAEGAAQGIWAMEEVLQRVAEATSLPLSKVREQNFYREEGDLKTTPYGQPVSAAAILRVWNQARRRSHFEERREAIIEWNRQHASAKRGIAITCTKFGLGDPRAERNAASVLVQIHPDGSVSVRTGLVDVGDGIETQIREETARHLGILESSIRVILDDLDPFPRTTPTLGTDASGMVLRALAQACAGLTKRLRSVALQLFAARGQTEIEQESIRFEHGFVGPGVSLTVPLTFPEVVEGALRKRISLLEVAHHRAPNLWWDPEVGAGWPFSSFTYAAAVTEIQLDAFTGEVQILRVDFAHEGSPSPDQSERDEAQLIRAYHQGATWMLCESPESTPPSDALESAFAAAGAGLGFADAPFQVFSDRLRPLGESLSAPGDPCAEAPLILANSIREAVWDALSGLGFTNALSIDLPFPLTPPRVLATCREISRQVRERSQAIRS